MPSDDAVDDSQLVQSGRHAVLGEDIGQQGDDLSHPRDVVVPHLFQDPQRLGRHLIEARDTLAAQIELAWIAGVIDLHAGALQIFQQADDLQAEQGKDGVLSEKSGKIAVDLIVVVVAGSQNADILLGRQVHALGHALKRREIGRQVQMGIDPGSLSVFFLAGLCLQLGNRSQVAQCCQGLSHVALHEPLISAQSPLRLMT